MSRSIKYSEATPEEKAVLDGHFEKQGWDKAIRDAAEQFLRSKYTEEHPGSVHLAAFLQMAGLPPDSELPEIGTPLYPAMRVFIALADAAHDLNHSDPARVRAASAVIAQLHAATRQDVVNRRSFVTWVGRCASMIREEGFRPVAVAIALQAIATADHEPAFASADLAAIERALTSLAAQEIPNQEALLTAAATISCNARAWNDGLKKDAAAGIKAASRRFRTAVGKAKGREFF